MMSLLAHWKTAALAAAAAAAFGAGWQTATWRAESAFAAERLAAAAEATKDAERKAEALETQTEATRAAEARVVSLRRDFTKLQEALNEILDDGSCGLDADRVRLINGLR